MSHAAAPQHRQRLLTRARRPGRATWSVLAFLAAYVLIVAAVAYYYLVPAMRAYFSAQQTNDTRGQRAISATSTVLMLVLLLILVSGLVVSLRVSRYFFPRKTTRTQTRYVDAWAESAKRMPTPPPEDEAKG